MKSRKKQYATLLFLCSICLLNSGCQNKTSTSTVYTTIPEVTTENTTLITNEMQTTTSAITEITQTDFNTTTASLLTTTIETTEIKDTIQTDDSASVSLQEDGSIQLHFYNDSLQLTLPPEWTGKFIIENGTVYNRMCWETEPGWGKLFSVSIQEPDLNIAGTPIYLLGSCSDGFVTWIQPQGAEYDVSNAALNDDYLDMVSDLDRIRNSAVCENTDTHFTPVCMIDFSSPSNAAENLCGTWDMVSEWSQTAQWSPLLVFCHDGRMAYQYGMDLKEGIYFVNTNPTDSEEDMTAIAYFDATLHQIKVYPSAPVMLEISNMQSDIPSNTWMFTYWNDNETYGLDEWMQ